jgi:hypothetical protein
MTESPTARTPLTVRKGVAEGVAVGVGVAVAVGVKVGVGGTGVAVAVGVTGARAEPAVEQLIANSARRRQAPIRIPAVIAESRTVIT